MDAQKATSYLQQKCPTTNRSGHYVKVSWLDSSSSVGEETPSTGKRKRLEKQQHCLVELHQDETVAATLLFCFGKKSPSNNNVNSIAFCLTRGSKRCWEIFFQWMGEGTTLHIGPVCFAPRDLARAVELWTNSNKVSLSLTLDAPQAVAEAGLQTLSLDVPADSIKRFQSEAQQDDDTVLDHWMALVTTHFGIRVKEGFTLSTVKSEIGLLSSNGTFRPFQVHKALETLQTIVGEHYN